MTMSTMPNSPTDVIVPLYAEDLSVTVAPKVTGHVRVHVQTTEHTKIVCEKLDVTHVEVERVPVGRVVDAQPPVREEGDMTIVSVVEEVLVIERRLVLKEEIRLRRVHTTVEHREPVVLRKQAAIVERLT